MMEIEKPKILLDEQENGARALITVEPMEKGFGTTIGNMLRRTLLSSLPGAAIVGVKIKGVLHEFSTIKGVSEDVPDIILNLKAVAVKTESKDEDFRGIVKIRKKGAGVVYARHICMYLLRTLTDFSLSYIGSLFGCNHANIISANNKIEELMETNEDTKKDIETLTAKIKKQS